MVVGAGHAHLGTKFPGDCLDSLVVGGDPHFRGLALQGKAIDMLKHWLACDRAQRFARQPDGCVTCRDDDHKFLHVSCFTAALCGLIERLSKIGA
jgi:hypothetical protein